MYAPSCEKGRTRGTAEGARTVSILIDSAHLCKTLHIGSPDKRVAINGADHWIVLVRSEYQEVQRISTHLSYPLFIVLSVIIEGPAKIAGN